MGMDDGGGAEGNEGALMYNMRCKSRRRFYEQDELFSTSYLVGTDVRSGNRITFFFHRFIDRREDSRRRPTRRSLRSMLPPLLLHRCFCHWNNEGESRRERFQSRFSGRSPLLSSMVPPRSCSTVPQVLSAAFIQFVFVRLRKSVRPVAVVVRSHDRPKRKRGGGGGRQRDNNECGGRGGAESTSVAESGV